MQGQFTCAFPKCEQFWDRDGYCTPHYWRIRTQEAAFWRKVAKADGDSCWEWVGNVNRKTGYGTFHYGPSAARMRGAHRYSWELHHGPIPDGLFVCHHCDNRKCVRIDHLFLGTATDNVQDMIAKGRAGYQKRVRS